MSGSFSHSLTDGQPPVAYPVALSVVCHVVVLALFVISPTWRFEKPKPQSSISVSMVSMRTGSANVGRTATPAKKASGAKKTAPVKAPEPPKTAKTVAPPVPKTVPTPPTPQAPPKPKASLKQKTFKSTQVVKEAVKALETKVEAKTTEQPAPETKMAAKTTEKPAAPEEATATAEQLQSALDRLRQSVGKEENARSTEAASGSGEGTGTDAEGSTGKPGAALGPFNQDGDQPGGPVDVYSHLVAKQIEKNWAFNERVANVDRSLKTLIVFKVMPNGEIIDIFFTDRSGNAYMDESAYKAIVKSNPVAPHPPGLNLPYVQMGLRFTPQGLR